jgi:hypothetical protein
MSALARLRGFEVTACSSYTPWEFIARRVVAFGRRTPDAAELYDFGAELQREVSRAFKLYRLRKAVTGRWFKLTATSDLRGEMMFVALRRVEFRDAV